MATAGYPALGLVMTRATPPRTLQCIAFASGKGGVGKTLVSLGMGWYLTRLGYRVVVVDLDFGVGNLQLSAGLGKLEHSLDAFVRGGVEDLSGLLTPVPNNDKLFVLAGAGKRSSATGLKPARRRALLEALRDLPANLVVFDLGAGCSAGTLDYFQAADHRIVVGTPDLASMTALAAFLKKAHIGALVNHLTARDPVFASLSGREFTHLSEVYAAIEDEAPARYDARELRSMIKALHPAVVLNRVGPGDEAQAQRIGSNLTKQFGAEARVIGRLPEDEAVTRCRRAGRNLFSHEPRCAFALAMAACANYWHEHYHFKAVEPDAEFNGSAPAPLATLGHRTFPEIAGNDAKLAEAEKSREGKPLGEGMPHASPSPRGLSVSLGRAKV